MTPRKCAPDEAIGRNRVVFELPAQSGYVVGEAGVGPWAVSRGIGDRCAVDQPTGLIKFYNRRSRIPVRNSMMEKR